MQLNIQRFQDDLRLPLANKSLLNYPACFVPRALQQGTTKLYTVLLVASQLSRSRSIRSCSLPAPDSYLISLLPRHAWLRHQPDRSHTLLLITRIMRIAVADDGGGGRGRGRGDGGRGRRKDTA